MKRVLLVLAIWAAAVICMPRISLAGEAPPAVEGGGQVTAGHEGGGEGGAGELVPVSPEAQKQALVQAIWVLIIFAILCIILYPTAWKGVLHGLKAREARIRKDISDAEEVKQKAQQTLAEYNKQLATAEDRVRELLAKAQADGERLAGTIRDNASKEAESIKNRAMADIEDAGKRAMDKIYADAAELSTAIAEKIIRRNLNADDQRALVQAGLQELEASRRN